MTEWTTRQALLLVAAMLVLLVVLIREMVRERDRYYMLRVKNTSSRYKALIKLNKHMSFDESILELYEYEECVQSKKQFDSFNFDQFLCSKITDELSQCERIIQCVKKNREQAALYREGLDRLPSAVLPENIKKSKLSYRVFAEKEEILFRENLLNPVLSPVVRCVVHYVTPMGRNEYYDEKLYSFDQVMELYRIAKHNISMRKTAYYQRKIMTDSLRYDILKRDGFRCVICGRSAQEDHVKLHVDHIQPVSRGGKTVPENLRTLCSTCNMGKRDKYDEYGWN